MRFEKMTITLFLVAISFTPFFLHSEIDHNLLPIGSSPYRHAIGRIEPEQIIDCRTGLSVTIEAIADRMKETDLFIIGEIHDSFTCHQMQRDLLTALQSKYPKLVVGFEFFEREDDIVLQDWSHGKTDLNQIIEKTGWYAKSSLNFGYTAMILEPVKTFGLTAVGLNIPRSLARKISRKGFAALTTDEKNLFPSIGVPNPDHEFFVRTIFGEMAVRIPAWFDNIYAAQKAWDVVMAESMHRTLLQKEFEKHKGIIIAGSNHVAYQLGIPFRYRLRDRKARIVTIVPVRLPSPEEMNDDAMHPMMKMLATSSSPSALFSRGIADYVFAVPYNEPSRYPTLGVSVREENGKLKVTDVEQDSLAHRNGFRKDDIIESIDDVPMDSSQAFYSFMASRNWGDGMTIRLQKKIELIRKSEEEKNK